MDDFDDRCACCSSSQSSASNLASEIFKVNVDPKCGHRFCQRCIENQISRKRNFCCPICHIVVIQEKLSIKSLDDWEVDKDAKVRRRIRSIYNKTEDDFATLLEYQNYEELVEDIVFNLVHGIDREATETIVREYERSNMREIAKKQSRMQDQEHRQQELIFQEEELWKQRQLDSKLQQDRDRLDRFEYRRQMNEFLLNERDTMTVVDPRARLTAAPSSSSTGISATALTVPTVAAGPTHPAYLVLYQRPQPKPLSVPPVHTASTTAGRVPQRDIWRAGGYDPLNHTRKNWREVVTTVPVTVASIENEHSQHLCIPSRSKCIHERMNSHSSSAMEVDDSNNLWTSHIFESDLLFSHLSSGTVVTDFGGHIPVSWV